MNQFRLIKLIICCLTTLLLAGCVLEGYDGNHRGDRHEHDRGDQGDNGHYNHGEHDGDR